MTKLGNSSRQFWVFRGYQIQSVRPVVVDDRHIRYDDEVTSLSRLAKDLKGFDHPVQGTLWFKYEGEVLDDRRRRLEKVGAQ